MAATKKINTNPTMEDHLENFENNFENINTIYSLTESEPIDEELLKEKTNLTIAKFAAIEQISIEFAIIGISALLQAGAYLRSVPNRTIKFNNKEFSKKSLIFAAEQANNTFTLRNMARHLRKIISKIAYKYNIPGHLFARFRVINANYLATCDEETRKNIATYCTDFQLENPDTPQIVREFLASREKDRFQNRPQNPNNSANKRKR